jgi:hypothetical protein
MADTTGTSLEKAIAKAKEKFSYHSSEAKKHEQEAERARTFLELTPLRDQYPDYFADEDTRNATSVYMGILSSMMKEKPKGRGDMAKIYDNAIERAICNGDGSANADDILLAIQETTGLKMDRAPLYAHISRRKKTGMIIANPEKYGSYMLAKNQGNNDARLVTGKSGRQNQSSLDGSETATF